MGSEAFKGPIYKPVGSLSRGLKLAAFTSEMFQVGLPCYLGLNSDQSVSININKTRKHFPETFMAHACFPKGSQFPIRDTLFLVSVFAFKMQIMLTPHAGLKVNDQLVAYETSSRLCT